MRTWENYKKHVKTSDKEGAEIVGEIEGIAEIVGAIISKREEMGISQSDIAERTGLSLLTISQVESLTVIPSLSSVLVIHSNLGLKITISDL